VFLCKEYAASANCCIEIWEAIQTPSCLIICCLDDVPPLIRSFFLERKVQVVDGPDELIPLLNKIVTDKNDNQAFSWWRKQPIAKGQMPTDIVPGQTWEHIPPFKLWGAWSRPERSLQVGPVYLAGDCCSAGLAVTIPWLFVMALIGLIVGAVDGGNKYLFHNALYSRLDLGWLFVVWCSNIAPFVFFRKLLDTRSFSDMSLSPLLATRAINNGRGVAINIVGAKDDPIAVTLREFFSLIGHLFVSADTNLTDRDEV
jgi:hypothetical protein